MKYHIHNQGFVEGTQEEIIAVVRAIIDRSAIVEPRKHKKHKKHNHVKTCSKCGRSFKGLLGLGVHRAKCDRSQVLVVRQPYPSPSPSDQ